MRCQEHVCDEELCWHIHQGQFSLGPPLEGVMDKLTATEIMAEQDAQAWLKRQQQALAKLIAAADGLRIAAEDFRLEMPHGDDDCSSECELLEARAAYDTARAEWEKLK